MTTTTLRPDPLTPVGQYSRMTLPTGAVVPDLSAKGSLVLERWSAQRTADRNHRVMQDRLRQQSRSYQGAQINRTNADWIAMGTSADSELITSLRVMRNRSRQLVRDNPYAKQAVRVIVNNVVGSGVGMQCQVSSGAGKLLGRVNDRIESLHARWAQGPTCHVAGVLSLADIERFCMSQVVTAGECVIRIHRRAFGGGVVPMALEVIEADRLMDQWQTVRAPNGNLIRMGVEMDEWGRAVAYWFWPRHPGDYQFTSFVPDKFIRVEAADVIHLYMVDRWPQTRGEPWFHSVLSSLHQQDGYEEAEVIKARAAANVVGFVRSAEGVMADGHTDDGRQLLDTEPGTWQKLLPGEDVAGFMPPAPNPALEPFLRYMLRKMASGVGISYESLSRDYTGATYSSARLALLDDRDMYRMVQGWLIRNLRVRLYREFLDAAVLVGALSFPDYYSNVEKYQDAIRFRPRGWNWIDPSKEVIAYKTAVRCGFMSSEDVIAQTGNGSDFEDVYKSRAEELELADELGLVFDVDPGAVDNKGASQSSGQPASEPADPESAEVEPPDPVGQDADESAADPTADPADITP